MNLTTLFYYISYYKLLSIYYISVFSGQPYLVDLLLLVIRLMSLLALPVTV